VGTQLLHSKRHRLYLQAPGRFLLRVQKTHNAICTPGTGALTGTDPHVLEGGKNGVSRYWRSIYLVTGREKANLGRASQFPKRRSFAISLPEKDTPD
jgi:hypothetical protein